MLLIGVGVPRSTEIGWESSFFLVIKRPPYQEGFSCYYHHFGSTYYIILYCIVLKVDRILSGVFCCCFLSKLLVWILPMGH